MSAPVALVVRGAEEGDGSEVARALAARGWALLLTWWSGERYAQAFLAELRASGATADTIRVSPSEDGSGQVAAQRARQLYGRVDALVLDPDHPVDEAFDMLGRKQFERALDAGLTGLALMTRALLPDLGRTRGSLVVVAAADPVGSPAQAAAEGGVRAWARASERELSKLGVRLLLVEPGPGAGERVAESLVGGD